MQVRVLGPVELEVEGQLVELGPPQQRAVLALLALEAGRAVPVDAVVEGLWGEGEQPSSAGKMVQLYVSQLRKLFPDPELIATRGRAYELQVGPDAVDALRFERLVDQGTAEAAREALSLWRGPALADVVGEPFAAAHARRLEDLRLAATEVALGAELDAGRHVEVVGRLRELVREHPLRERLHALLMLALYGAGRQAEALEAYRAAREALVEAAGLDPGPELRRLQEAILRQDPDLDAGVPAPGWARRQTREDVARAADATARRRSELRADEAALAAGLVDLQELREDLPGPALVVCPYKGLASFQEADAPYFFGRERLVAELVARLVGAPLLGLVGPSGSGKSSALRAGLLPALAGGALPGSDRWRRVLLRPGEHPVAALRHALDAGPGPGGRLVLAVDQFEEVFTACADETERRAFLDDLVEACERPAGDVVAILAIRADHYGACTAHPRLARLLADSHVLAGPLTPEELSRAIQGPALQAGLVVEPELVRRLVADVAGRPGALPLLSTALLELWRHRDGRSLRLAAYERAGGVESAVARLAEDAYARLGTTEQTTARRMLLRMAAPGEGETVVRRRVSLDQLDVPTDPAARRVLDVLADGRLVAVGDHTAEIAHEALLREWPRLRGWLEQDAEGRRLQHRLAADAREWDAGGRDPGDLARGARLAALLDWAATHEGELNRTEREFLAQARRTADRANRRLRVLLAGALGALAVAVAAGLLALDQRGDARDTALRADAQRLGAQAQTEDRLERALLLARAGVAIQDTVATRGNLLSVLLGAPPAALGVLRGQDDAEMYACAVSPDGRVIAIGDAGGNVTAYDSATRRRLGTHRLGRQDGDSAVQALAFSPDGRTLAAGGVVYEKASRADLLDSRTLRPRRRVVLPAYQGQPGAFVRVELGFFPGGRELVVSQTGEGPTELQRLDARSGSTLGAAVTPGRIAGVLAVARDRPRVFLAGAGGGETLELDASMRVVRRHPVAGVSVATDESGGLLAIAGEDGAVRVLDVRSGAVRRLGRHQGPVLELAFTPDGRTLASGSEDGTIRTWDVAAGRLREELEGHRDDVWSLDAGPDGTLYSSGSDAQTLAWDLTGRRRLVRRFPTGRPFGDEHTPRGLDVSPDGRTLAFTQGDGSVQLLDAATLQRRAVVRSLRGLAAATAFSPDGRALAVGGRAGEVRLHDLRARDTGVALDGLDANVQAVAFSPDGRVLAAAEVDTPEPDVQLWDVRSRRPLAAASGTAAGLAFSPDGRLLAAGTVGSSTEIRDGRTARLLRRLPSPGLSRSVAFSPDGDLLAVGQLDGTAQLWSTSSWKLVGRVLQGHRQRITAIGFSPGGDALFTAGADGTARLWDAASRQAVGRPLVVREEAFLAAVLAPDGRRLFAVPTAGPGAALTTDPQVWSRHACLVAGREMTAQEWRDAVPDRSYRRVCR